MEGRVVKKQCMCSIQLVMSSTLPCQGEGEEVEQEICVCASVGPILFCAMPIECGVVEQLQCVCTCVDHDLYYAIPMEGGVLEKQLCVCASVVHVLNYAMSW